MLTNVPFLTRLRHIMDGNTLFFSHESKYGEHHDAGVDRGEGINRSNYHGISTNTNHGISVAQRLVTINIPTHPVITADQL